jgi:ABC-type transporter Mla subunit MlaD
MIAQLGAATRTLSGSQDNLFQTIDSLQQFTAMLKNNNDQVQGVTQQLASVSGFLAADRQDLGQALNQLADALGQVQGFIKDNRARIASNVSKLNSISQILTNERASLAEALNDAPLAVDNLLGAYDTTTHTLDGRSYIPELAPDAQQGSATGFAPVTPEAAKSLPDLPLPLGTVYGKTEGGGR